MSTRTRRDAFCKLTSGLKLITTDASGLLFRALNELKHGRNSVLVTRVDIQKDALQGHVLVQARVGILRSSGSCQSQKLREDE